MGEATVEDWLYAALLDEGFDEADSDRAVKVFEAGLNLLGDPRQLGLHLRRDHSGMHPGVACFCGAPTIPDVPNNWPSSSAAFDRHLWNVLLAMPAPTQPSKGDNR